MAFVLGTLCRETTDASGGTAVLTLGGTLDSSWQTFVAGVGAGNSTDYAIREAGVGWIVCRGTVGTGPDTLTRISILASSAAGGDVTFSASAQVYGVASAEFLSSLLVSGGPLGTPSSGSAANLTGLPLTGLANIADLRLLANISGGSAAASANTLSAILDAVLGSTRGELPYRGSSAWSGLSPGKAGYTLQLSNSLDPTWVQVQAGGKGGTTGTATSEWKQACNRATTAALPACTYSNGSSGVGATLTGSVNGALAVDGATVTVAHRILVKDQAAGAQNGAYVVTTVGSGGAAFVLTRVADYDQAAEVVQGSAFLILSGNENSGTAWVQTTSGTITLGTTGLVFDALTATLPECTQGQVLGNALAFSAPAIPTNLAALIRAALGDGTAGQVVASGGSGVDPAWASRPLNLIFNIEEVMTNAEETHRFIPPACSFPSGAAGSYGTAGAAATGPTTLTAKKGGVAFGTWVWAGAGTAATVTIGSTTAFNGSTDILTLEGPATADATLAKIGITLTGTRA